jgi:hypothetical protein
VQSHYEAEFVRDMACSVAEWLSRLPAACAPHALQVEGDTATVDWAHGRLRLAWTPLPDRVIALMRLSRLQVRFCFEGPDAAERLAFMRRFDLTMQRGGG